MVLTSRSASIAAAGFGSLSERRNTSTLISQFKKKEKEIKNGFREMSMLNDGYGMGKESDSLEQRISRAGFLFWRCWES